MSILKREILYPGKTDLGKLEPETKLLYHFETVIIRGKDSKPIVIDDSRRMAEGQPVETIYGKQFKLPIWESCLSAMRKGEICRLTVRDDPKTHYICLNYVTTSKCFRKHYGIEPSVVDDNHSDGHHYTNNNNNKEHANEQASSLRQTRKHAAELGSSHHNCSMSICNSPYKDLNDLIEHPPEIFMFTFELVNVIPPESYTKDIWQMSDAEKLIILPKYREEGNRKYAECDYEGAASAYTKALGVLESLMLRERPRDTDWLKLDDMKTPFLLNLAQVKLIQGEYYDCIKYTDEVLKKDPENIKALFRRAKANAAVWNTNDARKDFKKCIEYDRNMTRSVTKCVQELKTREMLKNREDRERFERIFNKDF